LHYVYILSAGYANNQ